MFGAQLQLRPDIMDVRGCLSTLTAIGQYDCSLATHDEFAEIVANFFIL
jgi:hypothetical protein